MAKVLFEQFSSFIQMVFPLATLATAIAVGYSAAKINRKNKMTDVAIHCINRYDVIAHDRSSISSREEALNYYRRYFGLKSDQFDYWLSGLIDAENMASWSYATLNSFELEKHVSFNYEGREEFVTFSEGWEESLTLHEAPNATFVRVMERIQEIAHMKLSRKEKYAKLIELLEITERVERDFIRFADTTFLAMRIRGGDMRAFRKMEKRHNKRVSGVDKHLSL
tara:strand:- start:403269 stop:403940 length:672 start_codon:yes stop_codon:yes gene_type:complete